MNGLVRVVLAALVAIAAVPMFAEPADYSISLDAAVVEMQAHSPDRIAIGETIDYEIEWRGTIDFGPDVVVEIDVPGIVTFLGPGGLTCTTQSPIRCTAERFLGLKGQLSVSVRVDAPGTYSTTARVIPPHGAPDANPSNDRATHTFQAVALPSLEIGSSIPLDRVEPGSTHVAGLFALNRSATPATNAALTITLSPGSTIVSTDPLSGDCIIESNNVAVCRTPFQPQNKLVGGYVTFTAPPRMDGEELIFQGSVTLAEEDLDPSDNSLTQKVSMVRQFIVNNVNDEGGGSLRQAIIDANATCPTAKPCAILFRIPAPVPDSGWFTILPKTPLPEIEATLELDGARQTLFTGNTNPDGPEIEIDGAFVKEGSGLSLRPNCDVQVRNLAVNRFPAYGIVIRRDLEGLRDPCASLVIPSEVRANYLGTDPSGRIAKSNQRGVGLFTLDAVVRDNLISGNRRAGVYVENGRKVDIGNNRIGVGADGSPLGNGAGIFLDARSFGLGMESRADVKGNVIAYNDGMAIARTRRGTVHVSRNSIFDNLQQGIDVDLDGVSPQRADGGDVPNAPKLFSASYDAVRNATVIRGRIDSDAYGNSRLIEVYASSRLSVWATPQAEKIVGAIFLISGHHDFEAVLPEDLRGKWLTVTYTVSVEQGLQSRDPRGVSAQLAPLEVSADTSELSNAVSAQ
jgi:hypothetical protein